MLFFSNRLMAFDVVIPKEKALISLVYYEWRTSTVDFFLFFDFHPTPQSD